jgi:hypothetical protein
MHLVTCQRFEEYLGHIWGTFGHMRGTFRERSGRIQKPQGVSKAAVTPGMGEGGGIEYPSPYAAAGRKRRPEGAPRDHI